MKSKREKTMNITIINGQNRKGSSYTMGRMLAEKLTDDGSITEFFLPRDLNHYCLGCYACIEDEKRCPFWEEKKKIMDAMKAADLLIFTTPNYCMAPSGAMKSFLDMMFDAWMVHKPKEWMFQKKAVILSTSAGASCGGVLKVVKASLAGWGIPYIKAFGLPVHAMNWNGVPQKKKEKIEKKLTSIAKKLKKGKPPHVGLGIKVNFMFMRMLHIKGWDSSPTEAEYWKEKGWLGKARPWKKTK